MRLIVEHRLNLVFTGGFLDGFPWEEDGFVEREGLDEIGEGNRAEPVPSIRGSGGYIYSGWREGSRERKWVCSLGVA